MHILCVCDANSSAKATCIMFSICKYDKRMVTVAELTPTASTNPNPRTNMEAAPESECIHNRTFKAWVAVVEPDQREMPITTVLTERTAVPLAAPARVTMVIKVMIKFVL